MIGYTAECFCPTTEAHLHGYALILALSKERDEANKITLTLDAKVSSMIEIRVGGFIALYYSKERDCAGIASFWYHRETVLRAQCPSARDVMSSGDTTRY